MWNPAFSSAVTARRWLIPGSFGMDYAVVTSISRTSQRMVGSP